MSNLTPFARNSMFDDFFKDMNLGYWVKPLHGDTLPANIKLDVKETAEAYVLEAELPGVAKEHVHVGIEGSTVTLSAEVKQHDQSKEGKTLRNERYFGSVTRSVQFPQDIDAETAKAKMEHGVLFLTLPKKAAQRTKKLAIE